ncbi:MAG: hypothetical protein ACOYKZ_04320 [Chlamydiia bacterium]
MQQVFSSPRLFPPVTKWILVLLLWGTLFFTLAPGMFQVFGWPSPFVLFGVHPHTISDWSFWQILTYGWTVPASGGFSFGLIFTLLIDLLFIGQLASGLERKLGSKALLVLWVGGIALGGLVAAGYAWMGWPSREILLIGNRAGTAALIIAWMMMYSDTPVLFFLAPIRIKWLAIGILAIEWFPVLEAGHFMALSAYVAAAFGSYLCCLTAWNLSSPFRLFWRFERPFHLLGGYLRRLWAHRRRAPRTVPAVIIDFKTGKEVRR